MIGRMLGHYRLVEKIGVGGMGEVYLARDERLERDVAVKVLPQGALSNEAIRKRLHKEARALSKVNHPNIETLLEFDRVGDVEYLVVEYVTGTSLNALLTKGPLPEKEIARLGVQLANGVAAAHAQKVVHCDLKPANLRITTDGRLKILDFGVAKLLRPPRETIGPDATTDSTSGDLTAAGTLPYMAPEQLQSLPVDPRTDIFACGAVLYEMATGQRPFPEETTPRLVDAILHQAVVPTRALNSRVSPELERIIIKCLQKEPENRYQSAQELEVDLRQLGLPRTTESFRTFGRMRSGWRVPGLAAACAFVLATTLVLVNVGGLRDRLWHGKGPGRVPSDLLSRLQRRAPVKESDWILVADFENQTSEKQFDRTVGALMSQALLESNYVNVVPRLRVLDAAKRAGRPHPTLINAELGGDICIRDGYRALLTGQIMQRGPAYVITVQLIDPHTEIAVLNIESEPMQSAADLYATADKLAAKLRRGLGESLLQIQKSRPLASVITPNLEALSRYDRALQLYADLDFQGSVAMAKSAIDLDPHFAMAHLLLAENYDRRADEKSVAEELALAKQGIDHVTDREKHSILALNYSEAYLYEKAAEEYRFLEESNPGDIVALRGLAGSLFWSGQIAKGLDLQRQTLRMTEARATDYSELMTMLIFVNRFSDALGAYEEARGQRLENLQMHCSAAVAHWGLGDLAAARRELENLATSGDRYYQDLSKLYMTELLIYQGKFREAVRELNSQPVSEPQAPGLEVSYLDQLIPAQLEIKHHILPTTYYSKLRSLGRESAQPEALRDTGVLAIELGDLPLARQVLSKMRKASNGTDSAYARCAINTLEGALALAEGQADAAIEMEQRAAAYPLSAMHYLVLAKAHEAKADWPAAADAYERYLERKGLIFRDDFPGDWVLSHLYLARALARAGRADRARYFYDEFFKLWDQADSDLSTVSQARAERQKLNSR